MHIELDGFEIARLLRGPERRSLAEALVGCTFFVADSVGDDGFIIEAVDPTAARVTVRTSAGKPHDIQLARGSVAPTPTVQDSIDRDRARSETPDPKDMSVLNAVGVEKELTHHDARTLAKTLLQHDLPNQDERFAFWSTAKRNGLYELLLVTLRKWATLVRGPMPADLAIQLTKVHRVARDFEDALGTVKIGLADPAALPFQQAILLTQRMAVLLDVHDITNDPAKLISAQEAYELAVSIENSPYLEKVKARLDRSGRA